MGLDQYAFAVRPHPLNTDTYIYWNDGDKCTEEQYDANVHKIAQWRKHPNLQGYMQKVYWSKGGEGNFNCTPVRVSFQDLKVLKEIVIEAELPVTQGFFFGESQPEDREDDLKFIDDAMKAIGQDMEIYYDSWW